MPALYQIGLERKPVNPVAAPMAARQGCPLLPGVNRPPGTVLPNILGPRFLPPDQAEGWATGGAAPLRPTHTGYATLPAPPVRPGSVFQPKTPGGRITFSVSAPGEDAAPGPYLLDQKRP